MNNYSQGADYPDYNRYFENIKDLKMWSDDYFKGGFRISEHNKDEINIIVLIGSFTFGVDTSCFRVYLQTDKGLELLLMRESAEGNIEVVENEKGLVFKSNEKNLLILPWDGVDLWSLN